MDILKLNKAKTSLKGSITRIANFMDNVSEHVDITELEVKLKKIDQLQRKIEEMKELLFGLETANPTEEAEFEEDLYKCETRLDDLEKLDNESRKNFELSLKAKDVPTFDEFIAFLEQRETILLSVDKNCIVETKTILRKPNLSFKTKTNLLMNQSVENKSCIVCKDKTLHPIFRCKKFLELNPEKRLDLVRLHKLCELCLRKKHKRMQCTSTYMCPCGKKHSRSLCTAAIGDRRKWVIPPAELTVLTNPGDRESNVVDSSTQNTVLSSTASQHRKNVLISTGSVFLRNNEGRELKCPVIFDSASNINIISRKMCDFLGIAIEKINSSVSGLNSLKQNLKGKTNTLISNKSGTFRENVEFFVTEKITGLTPSVTLDVSEIKIPEFLELSDPYFYEAKEIHALLNADIFFRIIKDNVYKVNKELLFRKTEFGWIAGGRLQGTNNNIFSCYFLKDNDSVDDSLKLFFELESLGIKDDPCYRKDDQAMNIFKETVQYNNNRVIFGVNSSPFLLAATIKYHIEKYNEIHPITVQHLDSFMYVDDWITGQDTREEALLMSRHAKNIMKEAGMEMRKWISNDTVLMAQWAAEGFDTHPMDASIRLGTNKTKVLGMAWQTLDDCLTFDTKAAYVKVRKQNEVLVNRITSKTRVAPLKAVTLPRLELLGALVAARLSSRMQKIVRKKKECKVFHWTDSEIVLFWIKGSSKRWKQFVANRVQEISKLTDPDSWFHCSGQDNPSDFLSRELSVDTLISNNKWWTGPAFLRTDELPKTVSECPELNEVDYLPELKSKDSKEHTVLTLNFNQTFFDHLLSRSNRFLTIVRVLRFLYRFLFNIRNPTNKKKGPLTSDEMEEAEIYLMKQVQLSSFYTEIRAMQNGDDICNKRNSKFSYEELLTLIPQIEAILNSRPLTPLLSDVDDLESLQRLSTSGSGRKRTVNTSRHRKGHRKASPEKSEDFHETDRS
ncbi:integrase catalytic domain-containing protein [Trichonephila clavipes]|nr:integrase catalytic domain-containing protein [Trichonephila clavipes]